MKYPQLVSSTTPASLQDWLEEELENRGIDGVYTRYILSLLQEDTIDLEPQECEHASLNNTYYKYADKVEIGVYPLSNSGRSKHQRWKSWGKDKLHGLSNCCCSCGLALDSEERKKSAAVECLKAASEQKIGLEKLIDEVCAKLKKINSATGKNNEDSEDINIACEELVELLPSSPHEQAEKYYAAFPALTDKLEPLTQLCHQQKSECILKNVWDGRKVIECASGKFSRLIRRNKEELDGIGKTRDDSLDRESDTSEKENSDVQYLDSKHQSKIKTCKFVETSRKENTIQENQKPLFIVPKMKTPSQRIPFSVKYLPFNQLKNKKITDTSSKLKSDFNLCDNYSVEEDPEENFAFYFEENDSKENISDSREWSSSELSDFKQHKEINPDTNSFSYYDNLCSNCAKFDMMYAAFSDIFEQNDIYDDKAELTELASKFNSKLADIWSDYEKNDCVDVDSNFLDDSLNFQDKETATLNNESVWTFKKEDFERVVQKPKASLTSDYYLNKDKISSTDIPLPHFFHSTQKLSTVNENSLSSNSFNNLNDSLTTVECCSNGTSENSDDNDLANILSDCSKSFNTLKYETGTPSPNESDRESTSRSSLTGAVKGLYSLWKSESSDSSLVFGMDLEKIWEPAPLEEKSNWMGIPLGEEKYSKTLTGVDLTENITYNSRRNSKDLCDFADSSLSKTKCTLTYHKGESRFVEVIPNRNKGKSESLVSGPNRESLEIESLSVEEEENLLTSPKTHFQPIGNDSLDVETNEDAEVMSLVTNAFESPKDTKECNKNLSEINSCMSISFDNVDDKTILNRNENIKNYSQGSESSLDIVNKSAKSPVEEKCIRAVSSSFEELVALTGQFTFDDQEIIDKSSQEKCEPFRFVPLYTWKTNQYKDKGTNTESVVSPPYDNHSDVANSDDFDFQPFMSLKSDAWSLSPESKILGVENKQFEWKWSTNDDEESPWNTVDTSETWNENILEALSLGNERAKGNEFKCHNLTALRKEIKDEEDELLRDISYLSDKKNCSLDGSLKEHKEFTFNDKANICDTFSADLGIKMHSVKHLFSKRNSDWNILSSHFSHLDELDSFSGDLYDSCFSVGDYDLDENITTLPQVPADKILYSTDLENEWRKSSQPFDIQVPKRSKIKYKSPSQRRPCSFYLEGNCRRSDCRFSHDLSTITCRFWEEASCFKGVTCPFLHGYPSANNSYQEESGINDCNYTLESEADFPSLSKVNNLDQESTPSLRTSVISKPVRAKRKRNKSHSAGSSEKASVLLPWSQCEMVHNLSDEA